MKEKKNQKKHFARWSSGTLTAKKNIKQKNHLHFVYMYRRYDIIDTHSTFFLSV